MAHPTDTTPTRPDYRAILSRPPRTRAEAEAQVKALIERDRALLERLARL